MSTEDVSQLQRWAGHAAPASSFTPYFSRGWRDDAIQRAYLEATYLWWGASSNNPTSSVYGNRMVHVPECAAWTWDARPYPFFPELTNVWTDGPNWRLGHWLTGRLGAVSLAALVRHLCLRAGMPEELIDVSGLWGAVEGYIISALEAPRASISTLARHFGFDAVESEGCIKFLMRGRIAGLTITPDSMVAPASAQGDVMELTRAQETELPQALKWQVARADEDYDAAQVEARRITVDTTRIASESFPMAIPPEEAERRCRRALMEAWVGRESAVFRLPPSRLALNPCDVILLDDDGRLTEMRLVSIADSDLRSVDAVRQDRAVYDLPPGEPRPASLSTPTVFGAPDIVLLDLPQLREDQPAHRPMIAAHAKPWPGEIAVYRSAATDGFALLTTFSSRARIGVLAADFFAGPVSRFDLGNALAGGTTVVNTPTVTFANAVTQVGMPQANLTAQLLGLGGATADSYNRLSMNTPAVLLNNAGTGIEATVNKAAAGNDAAFALKTRFSARALIGLLGNDDFSFKVSPDGSAFFDALKIDRTSGQVELPQPTILPGLSAAPSAPPSGKAAIYARNRAGAPWIDVMRPSGRDFPLQPHFGVNRIANWSPSVTATITTEGLPITSLGTVSHPTLAATDLAASMRRWRVTSAAVVDSAAEQRSAGWACWRGNAAGLGGWTFVTRISLTTLQATGMGFFGLHGSTAALATTLTLATAINCIGIGFQRGTHIRCQLVSNDGTGAPTLTDMGASFGIATGGVQSLFIAAPPNGSSVWVRVVDEVSGAVFEQEITTDLPANTQFLSPRLFMNNGATAAAVAYDCSGVYVETDF